jgi:ketosteroid isomerase-like protein
MQGLAGAVDGEHYFEAIADDAVFEFRYVFVHRSQEPGVLILEYEVHGKKIRTGNAYDNRFISVVTIEDRKIVHWRDYMDSLAAFTAETGAAV